MAIDAKLISAESVLSALGDPTRRTMVAGLSQGPATVSSLAGLLGITRTAVGQHIAVLEACGLAHSEKLGRVRTCRLNFGGLSVLQDWIDFQRATWERSLDQLGEVLLEDDE
ncbi:MAG: winged helix-turn-helix transcriptional regulator [Hyphomicrobium sp.]|nr:winged helix-turn-helix transcriptional regulator [Hyphomicrobium sp.]